jgi:hypothetical protein
MNIKAQTLNKLENKQQKRTKIQILIGACNEFTNVILNNPPRINRRNSPILAVLRTTQFQNEDINIFERLVFGEHLQP